MNLSFHDGYWSGIWVGLFCGIILGWMLFRLPVLAKRYMMKRARQNAEEIHRILGFRRVPLRTMQQISWDAPHVPTKQYTPRHLEPQTDTTAWAMFRDDPRQWIRNLIPSPRTATQVAEQTYKELAWSIRLATSGDAKSTRSGSGDPARMPAPWLGSTMAIVRASTGATFTRGASMWAASGTRSSTVI